jgi:hypothetical protein
VPGALPAWAGVAEVFVGAAEGADSLRKQSH